MAERDPMQPIIKRRKKTAHPRHGGAWKIAYADFITAMMAFFLLMWLLGSSTKGELLGIAEFFQTPLRVSLFGGDGAGDASSILDGGGQDLSKRAGQMVKADAEETRKIAHMRNALKDLDLPRRTDLPQGAADEKRLSRAMDEILAAFSGSALFEFRNQLRVQIDRDGLRIQITDDQRRPLFDLGSSEPKPFVSEILRQIAKTLEPLPNSVAIGGHTDGTPFRPGPSGYSNWELSGDRANAARRILLQSGLPDERVSRVVGFAGTDMIEADPAHPANRRISILVLREPETPEPKPAP